MENENVTNENVEVQPNIEVKDNGSTLTAEVTSIDPMAAQEDPKDTENTEDKPEEDKNTEDKPNVDEQTAFDTQVERDNEIKNDLAKHNIDFDALGEEYQKNGELSKESINDTLRLGLDETYNLLIVFFTASHAVNTIDKLLSSSLNQIELALNGIKAQMNTAYGTSNPTLMGGAATSTAEGYTSMEQMTKDMADPRYQVDPKFTHSVMMKIKNASIF